MMTSSPGSRNAKKAAASASCAPAVTTTSLAKSSGVPPCLRATKLEIDCRSTALPGCCEYWLSAAAPTATAADATRLATEDPGKSGKPCPMLIIPGRAASPFTCSHT